MPLTETQALLRQQERLVRRVMSDHVKLIRLIEDVRSRVAMQERMTQRALTRRSDGGQALSPDKVTSDQTPLVRISAQAALKSQA